MSKKKKEEDKKVDEEKLKRLNEKLDKFRADMILDEGTVVLPVFPEHFIEETKYKLGILRFFDARKEDKEWAAETVKKLSNIITPN